MGKKRAKETEHSNLDIGAHSLADVDDEKVFQVSALGSTNVQHPKVMIQVGAEGSGDLVPVMAIADTGAMANVWGLKDFLKSGFSENMIQPAVVKINTADEQCLDIHGKS